MTELVFVQGGEYMRMEKQTDWMHSVFRGATAYQKQDYKLAEQMLRQALAQQEEAKIEPSERSLPEVLENLSLVFAKQGRFIRAERVLKRAIAAASSQQSACRLRYKLAQLYLLQGRYALAERVTLEAVALGQLCPIRDIQMESEQLLRLAALWLNWGQDQIALDSYRKVQEIRRACLFPFATNLPTIDSAQLPV
jgi:tetratricopeptide (TPR) repeat protein